MRLATHLRAMRDMAYFLLIVGHSRDQQIAGFVNRGIVDSDTFGDLNTAGAPIAASDAPSGRRISNEGAITRIWQAFKRVLCADYATH